ncbi:MAG: phage tail sheath subtilisin-like domain-containing protein [Chloroflexota bacterium]|nr:phage tail sheath subtilisin-like domain-containing protein [Chloroflexota bacterium]
MPGYQSPGVYVEDVPSAVRPIAGVGTSTAGFVGVVANNVQMPLVPGSVSDRYTVAPANQPRMVTNWGEFTRSFGDIQTGNSVLAHSVYGFFNNGGTRCWITRVPGGTAAETSTQLIAALDTFKPIDEIAIVAAPGQTDDAVQDAVVNHCANEHLQDRFAILDGDQAPATLTKADIQGGTDDSSYGAMYFPWLTVSDPLTGAPVSVPPSGFVAGVYSRVDAARGVHKAPANEVIRGVTGVRTLVSREAQAGLNPTDINVIRQFDGSVVIWGAHTLAGQEDAQWRYVNVRRLFLYLRESIDEGLRWVVFEPNDASLWAKITRNVTAFLTNVWRSGALFGATPEEAFYVKCDAETNPDDVRNAGQVVTQIGVAITKPAEFVVFRISEWAGPGS